MGQWHLSPLQSRHLGASHSSPTTISCHIIFSWISSVVWNLFLFKDDFSFGKSQKSHGLKSGLWRGWRTWVIWCFAKKLCTRHGAWAGALLCWNCQPPVAHSCGLNHPNTFHGEMFKLNTKFDVDSLLYSLSHFECDTHTVHMFTQQRLPPPLTSTVKSSLFTHVHSSPLSLAARLHWCHANHSHYINNGWTFSRQTSYMWNWVLWVWDR